LDANQGRPKQKELRKIFSRFFLILLILLIVTLNVQIKWSKCVYYYAGLYPSKSGTHKSGQNRRNKKVAHAGIICGHRNVNKWLSQSGKTISKRFLAVFGLDGESLASRWCRLSVGSLDQIWKQISCLRILYIDTIRVKVNWLKLGLVGDREWKGSFGESEGESESENKNQKVKVCVSESESDVDNQRKNRFKSVGEKRNGLIIVSTAMLINLTIWLTLLKQNVESHPGPRNEGGLRIITYNCNGLGNKEKMKRLLMKLHPLVEMNAIIFLQETHIVNTETFEMSWKHNLISNCVKTNSAGTMILYNKKFKLLEKVFDKEGRRITAVLQDGDEENDGLILSNVYYPNDHKAAIKFAEQTYVEILESQVKYPNFPIICGGDINACLTKNDSMNRATSVAEQQLVKSILENNRLINLVDSYRYKHSEDGYTWKRGNCYSRLDHIFVSREIISLLNSAETCWTFESSDHAALRIEFIKKEEIRRGPGIVKVNSRVLEDPKVAMRIGEEIKMMMDEAGEHWDPHKKLEFLKVAIRSSIAEEVTSVRRGIKDDVLETEEELNRMEELKITCLKKTPKVQSNTINEAIEELSAKLLRLRRKLSETMSFVSKAKWFEYG